jgi:hypothetical protein
MLDFTTECERGEEFIKLWMFYFQNVNCCPFVFTYVIVCQSVVNILFGISVLEQNMWRWILAICTSVQDIIVKIYKNII